MGIKLTADYTAPIPRPVTMKLACDGDHGLLPAPVAKFDATDGAPRDIAGRHGWRFRYGDQMLVLCPECAGRKQDG